jgi:hypothetical protein
VIFESSESALRQFLDQGCDYRGRPITTTAITEAVMKGRGLDTGDVALCRLMAKRVGACLRHWENQRGAIRSMPGPGQVKMWELFR